MNITFAELKLRARRSLYGNLGTLAGIQVLMGVCGVAVLPVIYLILIPMIFIVAMFGTVFPVAAIVTFLLLFLVIYFVLLMASSLLQVGFSRIMLDIAKARPAEFGRLLFPFKNHFLRFAGITAALFGIGGITAVPLILFDLMASRGNDMYVGMRIALTLLQYVVMVWLVASFSQTYFLLLEDPEKKVFQCMSESYEMMKGRRLRFLLLQISFLGWYLLGYLSFGIGFIWIIPYVTCTGAHFHLDLAERRRLEQEGGAQWENQEDWHGNLPQLPEPASESSLMAGEDSIEMKTEEMESESWDNP